jgi:hypothetical protein
LIGRPVLRQPRRVGILAWGRYGAPTILQVENLENMLSIACKYDKNTSDQMKRRTNFGSEDIYSTEDTIRYGRI